MTADTLSSNVVNYLVWRYLQEAGFGHAALHLSKHWIRDPESLPFTKNVPRLALVHLLQDGLFLDQLQSETTNCQRRFDFGRDHGRPFSMRNGATLTLDQGIPAHELAEPSNGAVPGAVQDHVPRKGPGKRKRAPPKTNGIESRILPQMNGDAMDVDHNGTSHVTNSVRAESEAVASDVDSPTVDQIPISTLTIGQTSSTQIEKPVDLTPDTRMVSIKEKDKRVTITQWAPSPSGSFLCTVGDSLLRAHAIPLAGDDSQTMSGDLAIQPNNFSPTAFCLASHDKVFLSVSEKLVNEGGETMETEKLYKVTTSTTDNASEYRLVSSTAGVVLAIIWNESTELLLTLSTDGKDGSIKIWKDDDSSSEQIPKWATFTESSLLDACWISDSEFVVCGTEIFQVYEITDSLRLKQTHQTNVKWEKVLYDAPSGIIAARSMIEQTGFLGIIYPNDPGNLQTHRYPDQYLTDIAFRPQSKTASFLPTSPVLLATCSADGFSRLWDANQPLRCLRKLTAENGNNQKENVSFSPDGSLLAVAGPHDVIVWNPDRTVAPVATWDATEIGKGNWDPDTEGQFTLGWDPDGSRFSVTLGNQIAIVPFPR